MRGWLAHIPRTEARAAVLSITVGISLMAIKFLAYAITGSAAVFSDAVESIANVLASGVAFYSLMWAHRPADKEHPYGHGKVEFISAGFEGGMVLLAAVFIFVRTIDAIWHGELVNHEKIDWGLALVVLAMVINGGLGLYLMRVGRTRGSATLEADGKHLLSDAYTSIGVLAALAAVRLTGWTWLDPAMAIMVALYITWMAAGLIRSASAGLMDKQDVEDERLLRELLDKHVGPEGREPRICSYHKLRHRHSGRYLWVDFHIMVPSEMNVGEGHRVASALEREIEQTVGKGEADATAHVEPCNGRDCACHCPHVEHVPYACPETEQGASREQPGEEAGARGEETRNDAHHEGTEAPRSV